MVNIILSFQLKKCRKQEWRNVRLLGWLCDLLSEAKKVSFVRKSSQSLREGEGGRPFWGLPLPRTLMDFGVMCFSLNTWHMELFSFNPSALMPIMMKYAKVTDWLLVSQIVQNETHF